MERERRKGKGKSVDDLAIVKAAAWAWYQHGSGSEGKPMREFDITRSRPPPKPSRFKQETATKISQEGAATNEAFSQTPCLPNHQENSLFDTYEIERISKQLGILLESSSPDFYDKFLGCDHDRRISAAASPGSDGTDIVKKKKKKKQQLLNGFLIRNAVVCGGGSRDVVDAAVVLGGWKRPVKGRPVVGLASCRPRASHA